MNVAQLLAEMQARRITATFQDGRLRLKAPTGALSAEIRDALAIHRDAIVAALAVEGLNPAPIPPAPANQTYRASAAQERLWFLSQYEGGAAAYTIPAAVRLKGDLNLEIFQKSVDALVARHASLRTVFEDIGGEAHQRVLSRDAVNISCRVIDLSGASSRESEARANELVEEEIAKAFDLLQGPLLRVLAIRLMCDGGLEHIIAFAMHHIISDGWSCEILLREFAALYDAHLEGRDAQLPLLPTQYPDFAIWQRRWLSGPQLDRQLTHWRNALAGANFVLDLPSDRPRPSTQSTAGDTVGFEIAAGLSNRLRELSRKANATLYMTMLGAFFVLLSRWTGEKDICVGTPVANRRRCELEGIIGLFANTLIMRCDLSGNPDFFSLLARLRSFCVSAQDNQDLPFEQLVEAVAPQRDLARNPLFQTMFSLQNAPPTAFSLSGVVIEPFETRNRTSKFDLTIELLEDADGRLLGEVEYATALFDRGTIERMIAHYQTLLDAIVKTPDACLSSIDMLPTREADLLLRRFNEPHPTFEYGLLHELFAAQARRAPHAVAVSLDDDELSYQQLDKQSNRLAHWLVRHGVGPDTIVALCLERSFEMFVAILAVLKAGGAYLPLDPALPSERLSAMIEDAAPKVMVTQECLRPRLSSIINADLAAPLSLLFSVDSDSSLLERESSDALESKVRPDNLAYLIYTSGSTGKPKAVAVTHANVTRLFAATQDMFDFSAADVWTLFHSYAFDFSVWEMWGALLYGGRLVIVPFLVSRSPEDFHKLVCEESVTVLNQTPSAFYRFDDVDHSASAKVSALRLVIFGGEALDQRHLTSWFDRHPEGSTSLVNMYGITETTVHVTSRKIARVDHDDLDAGTVGGPLADLSCYILDTALSPVPIGVRGELYVGGAGLARGYLSRPELTAERFVPNPFASDGARLYRTGDLARYRPDGDIEYLGRRDHQVKLRGFRIELGEIEDALARLPDVRGAVALVEDDDLGERRLVAYVSSDLPNSFDSESAKSALRSSLPDYMVPDAIGALDRFPLNQNGKIDRNALPKIDRRSKAVAHVAPRTPAEWIVLQAFRETLGTDTLGMDDNFFEFGGNSILALKLVERIRRSLCEGMFVAAIFHAPTPAEIVKLIGGNALPVASPLVRLGARSAGSPLYCIHPAGGSTVQYRVLARRLESICGVFGLQSRALLDPAYEATSISGVARDFTAVIRAHQPEGPYRLLGWSAGAMIALAIAAEIERIGEQVEFVGLLDPAFDIDQSDDDTSMSGYLSRFAEFQGVRLDLSDQDERELTARGAGLDDRERFIAAGLWGCERGLWSDVSADLLAFLYDDSLSFQTMLAEHRIEPIGADIHVWWARGAEPSAAQFWTRGTLYQRALDASHESIVADPIVHDEIAATLADRNEVDRASRFPCEFA